MTNTSKLNANAKRNERRKPEAAIAHTRGTGSYRYIHAAQHRLTTPLHMPWSAHVMHGGDHPRVVRAMYMYTLLSSIQLTLQKNPKPYLLRISTV